MSKHESSFEPFSAALHEQGLALDPQLAKIVNGGSVTMRPRAYEPESVAYNCVTEAGGILCANPRPLLTESDGTPTDREFDRQGMDNDSRDDPRMETLISFLNFSVRPDRSIPDEVPRFQAFDRISPLCAHAEDRFSDAFSDMDTEGGYGSVIFTDEKDTPLFVRKANLRGGDQPTALTLRLIALRTAIGDLLIPEGAIVGLSTSLEDYASTGVKLRDSSRIDGVCFGRLSRFILLQSDPFYFMRKGQYISANLESLQAHAQRVVLKHPAFRGQSHGLFSGLLARARNRSR